MSTTPKQQHNGSAAPSARGNKKAKAAKPAKVTKAAKPAPVTVAAVRAEVKRQGKASVTSVREALLKRGATATPHVLWHGVRQILFTDPSFERVGKTHFALRQAQPAVGDLILEDGAHADYPAEWADFERGAVASAAMAETDEAE